MAKDSRGSSGSSKPPGRKRRSPTIDLSAEEVKHGPGQATASGKDDGAPAKGAERSGRGEASESRDEAGHGPAGASAASSGDGTRSPQAKQPEQPIPSAFALPPRAGSGARSSRGGAGLAAGLLAAALAGGLIALAGLFVLDRIGVLPLTDGTEETTALRDRAAELEQELAAARQSAELAREDLQDQLAELNARVAQLAEAAPAEAPAPDSALDEEVARLQAALAELREQVVATTPPAAPEDIDARLRQVEGLAERLAGLAEQVEALQAAPGNGTAEMQARLDEISQRMSQLRASFEQLQGAVPAEQDLSALESDVAGLRDQLGQLQGDVSRLSGQLQGAASAERLGDVEANLGRVARQAARAQALAPAVAAQGLAAALETGRPFARELSVIRALGIEDPALSQLAPYADAGLPNRAELRRRFQDVRPQITETDEPPPAADGPLERLWQSAQEMVEVRPAGPQEGGSPDAIASRIEAALQAGDLRRAMEEWQDLPPEAQAISQDWADQTGAVLAGEALAERLRSDALAALAPQD